MGYGWFFDPAQVVSSSAALPLLLAHRHNLFFRSDRSYLEHFQCEHEDEEDPTTGRFDPTYVSLCFRALVRSIRFLSIASLTSCKQLRWPSVSAARVFLCFVRRRVGSFAPAWFVGCVRFRCVRRRPSVCRFSSLHGREQWKIHVPQRPSIHTGIERSTEGRRTLLSQERTNERSIVCCDGDWTHGDGSVRWTCAW